ncbi:pyridoxamine 5'-phosphate oxidase family protein [Clostridiaceae bacterium WCA-383-APC-5B]|uniref:Pyridoxamine 5'-phosphate oxidase family protein n=1 Tax=Inconstantimicrobium porci TaxID=2652291 RepID=A0A7X2T1T1_9CLOT|nr:pyridoxamine 5'-phosphate oxidase family protein [Inconstantimicrobium porci]
MCITLPFINEQFSKYQFQSPQEFKYHLSEGILYFYFSTNTSSNKVKFFKQNPKASIYFMDKRFFRGVSLNFTLSSNHFI